MIAEHHTAIRALLIASTDVTNLVGQRIYANRAPVNTPTPYIVFSINSSNTKGYTFKSDKDTLVYNVQGVVNADEEGVAVATDIATAIDNALNRAVPDVVGRDTYQLRRQAVLDYPEQTEQRSYHHAGGLYRLETLEIRSS